MRLPESALSLAAGFLLFPGKLDLPLAHQQPAAAAWTDAAACGDSAGAQTASSLGAWADNWAAKRSLEAAAGTGSTLPAQVWRGENIRVLLLLPYNRNSFDVGRRPVGAMLRMGLFGEK